jgi:hypothetical protein
MKVLKQILFTAALLVGFAVAASAQSDQPRRPPPKDDKNTPKIVVPPSKPPPTPNPPRDGKKPGYALIERKREISGNIV